MSKTTDSIFYNAKLEKWFFFGNPEEEITGLQAAFLLSLSDEEISELVKDDLAVFSAKPFLNTADKKFYKLLFTIKDQAFFVEVGSDRVRRFAVQDLAIFEYTN
jgi:hypothetical protein